MADDGELQALIDGEGQLIKPVFQFYDTDSDGKLSPDEVIQLLTIMGYPHPGIGFDTKPKMDFRTLMIHIHMQKKQTKESTLDGHVSRTFHMIDKQARGKIGPPELHYFLRSIDVNIPMDHVERIAELISPTEDFRFGEKDLLEYVKMVRQGIDAQQKEEGGKKS